MILMKSFLTGVLCDYMIYTWMIYQTYIRVFKWKGWRSRKWCLKMMIQSHLHVGFFTIFFIKLASLKRFYFYMKLLQSSSIFKQKTIMKCLVIKIFAWNVLQLPIQKKNNNNNNCNSRYSYNRQAWVDIPYLLFPWDAVHSSRNMTVCSNWSCYIRH